MERSCKNERKRSGCVVFEGNIVVFGGWSNNDRSKLNTVESYDFNANKWPSMPNMVHRHNYHSLVVARKELLIRMEETVRYLTGVLKNLSVLNRKSSTLILVE